MRDGQKETMNFQEWSRTVPGYITGDSLWKMQGYQLALFLADIGWRDVTRLASDKRTASLSDQLFRALGSIGANLAEGYSRSSGKDRTRFYEYALGSAREARGWYFSGRHVLGEAVGSHRMDFLTQVIRLLLTLIPTQRAQFLAESAAAYSVEPSDLETFNPQELTQLLEQTPFS
jgi:four helix bundle protein